MDSRLNARSLALTLAAALISGAAFYNSKGLHPQWWAMWLAALPVLWIAPQLPWAVASSTALVAGLIGELSMWDYHGRLQFQLWLRLGSVIVPAVVFCIGVVLFRVFLRRGQLWLAVLAFPSVITAHEYLISLGFGTFGATGYTQLQNLPVLQLATVTGLWGVGYIVMLFPSVIAAMILSPAKARWRLMIAFGVIFGCTLSYGLLRLLPTPRGSQEIVAGLVASDLPRNVLPQNDPDAMRLLREYAEQVKLLSQSGAKLVVLPEMTALVRDTISGEVDDLFRQTARDMRTQIVLGILHASANGTFNEARLYSEAATSNVVYRKHHLVPVLEGRTTPGNDIAVVREPAGTVGLEICRDMDYPEPSRHYGRAHTGLVLAPAWDFDIDRYWHGHMAIMRGVENGFTVVRAAKQGLLTVSDSRGRVLSEKRTTPKEPFTSMLATTPIHHEATLYQSWGDWFAWLNVAFVAGLFLSIVTKRPKERRADPSPAREAELSVPN